MLYQKNRGAATSIEPHGEKRGHDLPSPASNGVKLQLPVAKVHSCGDVIRLPERSFTCNLNV